MESNINQVTRIEEAVDFPKVILLDNYNGCNLRCAICSHKDMHRYRRVQHMAPNLYTKLIDEIAAEDPNARVWLIFFGEPAICKSMPQRIQYAKDSGLTDVVLNSNGVKLTPDISRAYVSAGLDAIYIGIDAYTEETYNKIRVGGNYKKAVRNAVAYNELCRDLPQKCYVQFVVCDENEHELEAFKEFWDKLGMAVKVRPKVSWAGLVGASNLSPVANRKPCYWAMQTMSICADGKVALCAVDVHCRVPCGDATKNSIKELWAGQKRSLAFYRKLHAQGEFKLLPEMCRNCLDWQSGYAEFVEG